MQRNAAESIPRGAAANSPARSSGNRNTLAWISRLLQGLSHQVIVANARKVGAISESESKNDRQDDGDAGAAGVLQSITMRCCPFPSQCLRKASLLVRTRPSSIASPSSFNTQ